MKQSIRLCICLIVTAVIFSVNVNAIKVYASQDIKVLVNGRALEPDQPPVIVNNRVLVPMRDIFGALGYTVIWYPREQKAYAYKDADGARAECAVYLNERLLWVCEADVEFTLPLDDDTPVSIVNSRIMLPVRAIAESLGSKADWDESDKTVTIDASNAKIEYPKEGWIDKLEAHMKNYCPDSLWVVEEYRGKLANSSTYSPGLILPSPDNAAESGKAAGIGVSAGSKKLSIIVDGIEYPVIYRNDAEKRYGCYYTDETTLEYAIIMKTDGQGRVRGYNVVFTDNPNNLKTYFIFDDFHGACYEYTYTNPAVAASAPKVGSVPAKILVDENSSHDLFIPNPADSQYSIVNVTEPYYITDGHVCGGCEWYAFGRFREVYGIPLPVFDKLTARGSSGFLDTAEQYPQLSVIRDTKDIKPNSVVVYGEGSDGAGHFAYVEYIERDAGGNPLYIYITEANYQPPYNSGFKFGVDGAVRKFSVHEFFHREKPVMGYIMPNADYYR